MTSSLSKFSPPHLPIFFVDISGNRSFLGMLLKGESLPGPENGLFSFFFIESGLLPNVWKLIFLGDTCTDKAKGFVGKGCPGEQWWGK